jgi:ferredoxin-NADP reductase
MLRYIAEEHLPHRVTLVYSNRDQESTAFLEELSELDRTHENIRLVLTMTDDPSWEGERRLIGPELLRDHLDGELGGYRYLLAGPPALVEAVTDQLRSAGIPDERIRPERFSGY